MAQMIERQTAVAEVPGSNPASPRVEVSNTERSNVQAPVTDVGKCCTDLGRGGGSLLRECNTKTAVKAGRWTFEAGRAQK